MIITKKIRFYATLTMALGSFTGTSNAQHWTALLSTVSACPLFGALGYKQVDEKKRTSDEIVNMLYSEGEDIESYWQKIKQTKEDFDAAENALRFNLGLEHCKKDPELAHLAQKTERLLKSDFFKEAKKNIHDLYGATKSPQDRALMDAKLMILRDHLSQPKATVYCD